jgi:hypothetical protein
MSNRDYFAVEASAAGISGDDVNRRRREAKLGFVNPPSADWAGCKRIARCLWPDQVATVMHLDGFYHFAPDARGWGVPEKANKRVNMAEILATPELKQHIIDTAVETAKFFK